MTTPGRNYRIYQSIDFTVEARPTPHWDFYGAYTVSWLYGPGADELGTVSAGTSNGAGSPFYNPRQTKFFDGENRAFAGVSVWPYFVVLGLAAFGVFALRRRRLDLIILLAPLVMVTLSSALGFGAYRFRLSAEPALLALAGVALARRLRT